MFTIKISPFFNFWTLPASPSLGGENGGRLARRKGPEIEERRNLDGEHRIDGFWRTHQRHQSGRERRGGSRQSRSRDASLHLGRRQGRLVSAHREALAPDRL